MLPASLTDHSVPAVRTEAYDEGYCVSVLPWSDVSPPGAGTNTDCFDGDASTVDVIQVSQSSGALWH